MNLFQKLNRIHCSRDDLDKILYGKSGRGKKTRIPIKWVILALIRYVIIMEEYKAEGLRGTLKYISGKEAYEFDENDEFTCLISMRRYMLLFRMWGKVFREDWNCLAQSCSLFGALYTLGFDVDLVIGKFVFYASEQFDFHAWVEYKSVPVNDKMSVYERCFVVYRYTSKQNRVTLPEKCRDN